jgi:UDP-N-acetylglucosamine 2-epimerase (non-hydrolysing)
MGRGAGKQGGRGAREQGSSAPPHPCTSAQLWENTEWPVTVTQGTNTAVGSDPQRVVAEALAVLDGKGKAGRVPELWDGKAVGRIVRVMAGLEESTCQHPNAPM